MTIRYQCEEFVHTTPEHAFATIDNLPLTARWLPPCVSLDKEGDGPNVVGDRLRYVYTQGRRQSEMAGEIVARIPGERLHCKYFDSMFDVSVDLQVSAEEDGTRTRHTIEISPKTLLGRLMGPLIRFGLRNQTQEAAANLKQLLESSGGEQ